MSDDPRIHLYDASTEPWPAPTPALATIVPEDVIDDTFMTQARETCLKVVPRAEALRVVEDGDPEPPVGPAGLEKPEISDTVRGADLEPPRHAR